jgi:hypothetical protein
VSQLRPYWRRSGSDDEKKKFSASKPGRRLQLRRLPLPDRHLPGPVPSRRQQARPLRDVQVQQEADRVEPSQDLQRDHGTVRSNTFTNHRAMPITGMGVMEILCFAVVSILV